MNVLTDWETKTKEQRQDILRELVEEKDTSLAHNCIDLVHAGQSGVYASMGPNFRYAIFGRDSIEVARHLLETHKMLVRNIILTLAGLQGVKNDINSEEEPGKIHHEFRSQSFDGSAVPAASLASMHHLQSWWGIVGAKELIYYGSCDATPMYISLVCNYVKIYGDSILKETYIARDGRSKTILECLQDATLWLTTKINSSPWQLLEYKRINPNGLLNQVWKDSDTAYLHIDGSAANSEAGIASVELQAYAYDALRLIAKHEIAPVAKQHIRIARQLQKATLKQLWMPKAQYFAQGLDRDPATGKTRQIQTLTSNPGLLLNSRILTDVSRSKSKMYVRSIVKTICSTEFVTAAGIRCRALKHKDMPGFVDYHGTCAVWPKDTFEIAEGLKRQGYLELANRLNTGILTSVVAAGDFYELFYVDETGKVWFDHSDSVQHFSQKYPGHHPSIPEPGQAWTISAFSHIILQPVVASKKMTRFEKRLLDSFSLIHS